MDRDERIVNSRERTIMRGKSGLRRWVTRSLVILGCTGSALAGTFTAMGPQNYVRGSGAPVTVITNFSVLNPGTSYTIKIYNGGLQDGQFELVSSSVIKINGLDLVSPSEFNQNVTYLEKPIPLNSNNALSVELHGQPGGVITILIVGIDNDLPTITGSASPQPNAGGWNKTDVTVTFSCQDTTSGIASCTSPVTISIEGENQVVTGTATDQAGNTATASVTVSLDTTLPTITLAISPGPNANGWNNSDVTISYTCADSLSGVPDCPPPVTVSAEGMGQVIDATVTDRAGNSATSTVTLNIDRTAPAITPTASPAPNAGGWNNTDVTVSYTCTDALSGVAGCPDSTVVATEGAGQVVTATATDRSGNATPATVSLSIDTTGPTLLVTAPTGSVSGTTAPEIDLQYSDLLSGVNTATLSVRVDGTLIPCSAAAAAAACQPSALASGSHQITAQIADVAGNQTEVTSSFSLNLDGPPTLTPIGDQTALLGRTSTFTVHASDPDGDPVTLMVTPIPLPDHATFDGTTGIFSFKPAVEQVGAYPLTFIASDGKSQVSESITLTVPAPVANAPTTLEGFVLDANSYANGVTTPIVGATISLLGTNRSAVSDAQGHFEITNAAPEEQVLDIFPGTGQLAPDNSAYAGFREAIKLVANVQNVIDRPFFLPRIDISSVTVVDPNATTVVTNPNLNVSITVPPHTAKNSDGSDFTGQMSISLVPRGLAPAPLPDNLDPGLLVTIQPVGVYFATPVPMTFPNLDNAPAGSNYDLWSLLASEGRFAIVGKSIVSADGQSVTTISGGVRAADWHTQGPPVTLANPQASQDCPPDTCCPQCAGGSSIPYHDGALLEDYETPGVRSLGVSRSIRLAYRSTTADVKPIIAQDVFLGQTSGVPDRMGVFLDVGGVRQGQSTYFDSSILPEDADSVSRLAVQFDASALPTGRYRYTEFITNYYPSNAFSSVVEGRVTVVNQRESPIGAGWGIAGLQRLTIGRRAPVPVGNGGAGLIDSTIITDGNGAAQLFEPADFGVFEPAVPMTSAHSYAAAAIIAGGKVLVAGGISNVNTVIATAEVYDPATGAWTPTSGPMNFPRYAHSATTLRDGRVLIVGGFRQDANLGFTFGQNIVNPAEIYNPATGLFTQIAPTLFAHAYHTATLLGDGEVLIAGADVRAELFNPVTNTFRQTRGNMHEVRFFSTATLMPDGRVFVAGGQAACRAFLPVNVGTEMYDPFTEQFTGIGAMTRKRKDHAAALLPDGRVLIAGGVDNDACIGNTILNTVEIMDTVTGTTTLLPDTLCSPKSALRAVTLRSGKVLLTGGYFINGDRQATACADLYDPITGRITRAPDMLRGRAGHIALSLPTANESILVTGGYNFPFPAVANADLFGIDLLTQGSAFISPPGDFSSLVRNFDGTFVRTYKDQTRVSLDAAGLETSVVDRNGNTTTFEYDAQQRLTRMTDPVGLVWSLAYGGDGTLQSITDPAMRVTSFTHDLQGNLTQIIKADGNSLGFAYDAEHRMIRKTDERGKVISYAYDFAGRFASATHPDGEVRRLTPTAIQGLPDPTQGEGTVANPVPITQTKDILAVSVDGNGHATTVQVNNFGSPASVADPLGRITQTTLNKNNQPTQIVHPNGSIVSRTYDNKGNLLSSTEQDDPNGPATTTYTYEPVFNQVTSATDPLGHTTTIAYDTHGNPTTITDARGKATILTFDARGLMTSGRDQLGDMVQLGYDPLGNLQTTTDPRGKSYTVTRNPVGDVINSKDPLSRETLTEYDLLSRVTRVIDSLNGITSYEYDAAGNLISLTDARDQTTSFSYDDRGLLTAISNPLGQTKSFTYDAGLLLEHVIDAKGQRIEFIYNEVGQLTRKTLKNTAGTVVDMVTYEYDLQGNLTSTSDGDSGLVFVYDALGRLRTASTLASPAQPATTITYLYDKAGNRVRMTDPHGNITTYAYDEADRLATLSSIDGSFTFAYDDANRRTGLVFPNGTRASYGYDAASQLTSLSYLDSTMVLLSQYGYGYDDKGNRTSRTTTDGTTTYTYDDLDRLTGALGPSPVAPTETTTESYAYDTVGNRISSHLTTGQQHDSANRLLGDSKYTYAYDANGNLISRLDKYSGDLTTYDWDVEDRLLAVHDSLQTVTFRYDPLGRRIERGGTTTNRFILDRRDVVELLDANNALVFRYTQGPAIDEPLAQRDISMGQVAYYLPDGLGSITDATRSTGEQTPRYRYDSFGNILFGDTAQGPSFTGREWGPTEALFYYRERYYDAGVGRFISSDPIGFQGGVNFYAYAAGNPIRWKDPFGLRSRVCCRTIIPYLIFRHCYIETEDAIGRTSRGLVGGLLSEEPFATGNIYLNNGFDTGGECGSWNEADCIVDQCVKASVSAYANPSSYRILRGPNSNSFASNIASRCGIARPDVSPLSTPGWGDSPAPQKPGTLSRPPTNLRP